MCYAVRARRWVIVSFLRLAFRPPTRSPPLRSVSSLGPAASPAGRAPTASPAGCSPPRSSSPPLSSSRSVTPGGGRFRLPPLLPVARSPLAAPPAAAYYLNITTNLTLDTCHLTLDT